MVKVKVSCRGKIVNELVLDSSRQYTAGRRQGCDILLENEKGISREHFSLSCSHDVWTVDLLSRFGELIYNGESTKQIRLKKQDTFQVPPFEFFIFTQAENFAGSSNSAPTELSSSEVIGPFALDPDVSEKTQVREIHYLPYVRIVDSKRGTQNLIQLGVGNTWIAGRDSASSIQIRDSRVSRRQFEIQLIGSNYFLLDLGSVNGTLLNGNRISSSEPTPLKSGDIIAVLDNLFYFELHDSQFQQKIQSIGNLPVIMSPVEIPQVQQSQDPTISGGANREKTLAIHRSGLVEDNFIEYEGEDPDLQETKAKENMGFKKWDKKFLIITASVVLLLAYLLSESPPSKPSSPVNTPKETVGQLNQEQRARLQQAYNLAKNLYIQQKYQLAASELDKVSDLSKDLPEFRELRQFINEALVLNEQLHRKELEDQHKRDVEEKINIKVEKCSKLISSLVTEQQIDDCLADVIALGPDHPGIAGLKQKAANMESERAARESQKADFKAAVTRLQRIYAQAEVIERKGDPLISIAAYEKVLGSTLPDPGNVKSAAKKKIVDLRSGIERKINSAIVASEKLYSSHEYKKAILTLREVLKFMPENEEIQDKINRYVGELRKEMMTIYQEGVLEESFGNVDGGENNPGAKERWKKILDLDVPDGEYYRKAKIKLKKYGVL